MKKLMIFAALLGSVACTDPDTDPQKLYANGWQLQRVEINDKDIKVPAEAPMLNFSDSLTINGNGGCNLFFGVYKADKKGTISIEPQGMTRAMCPDAEFEDQYIKALGQVNEFEFDKEYLELENEPLDIVLVYRKK
ncbi:MAG: META domain-containing protein [Marinifilaceae bacterium]|nr:META domain-containing protein [Marinifilaceae bacterium]